MRPSCFLSVALAVFGAAGWTQGVTVFSISQGAWSETEPCISFNFVAWTSDRDVAMTGLDIWGTDLLFDSNFPVCQDAGDQHSPSIDKWGAGTLCVWQDERDGTAPDVFGRYLSAPGSFPIGASGGAERAPRVWGAYVVYERDDFAATGTDIWACYVPDLTNFPLVVADGPQEAPSIDGSRVAWSDNRPSVDGSQWDVWETDIRTGEQAAVTQDQAAQLHPRVSGDWVVYEQRTSRGDNDIYAHRLSDPTAAAVPICTDHANQTRPAMWGNIVVWQDDRDGLSRIYGYDMAAGQEFRIDDVSSAVDSAPDISQDVVVFERWTRPKPDVFAARLGFSAIKGHVTLGSFVGDPQALPLTLLLWSGPSAEPIEIPIRLDADGRFTAVTLLSGSFRIGMKPSHWLTQVQPGSLELIATQPLDISFELINGDATHDDRVSMRDLGLVLLGLGDGGPTEADLDGDGVVTIRDLAVVLLSFALRGDTP